MMKRILLWGVLTVLVLLFLCLSLPAEYSVTPTMLQGLSWNFKAPLKSGIDYGMSAPAGAPTVLTNSGVDTRCLPSLSPKFKTFWIDPGGVSGLSPISATWDFNGWCTGPSTPNSCCSGPGTGSCTSKKATITRPNTAPSNALGWGITVQVDPTGCTGSGTPTQCCTGNGTGCSGSYLVASGGSVSGPTTLLGANQSLGSSSATASCTTSGVLYSAQTQAGFKVLAGINRLVQGVIDLATFDGTAINQVTEGRIQLDLNSSPPRFTQDGGGTYSSFLVKSVKTVAICATGCDFTTLTAACSSNTSTAANPVLFVAGPLVFTAKAVCSGQDHPTFWGAGPSSTIFSVTGLTGDQGCFEPGTSTNWTLQGFGLTTCHRGIYMDGATAGGGTIYIRDNEIAQENAQADEDCFFGKGFAAGTEIHYERNVCRARADGFTVKADGANVSVYARNNTFYALNCSSNCSSGAYSFESSPVTFDLEGDSMYLGRNIGFTGIRYIHSVGGATSAKANVRSVVYRGASTASNGAQDAFAFFNVEGAATELVQADLVGVDAELSTTDSTTGNTQGVVVKSANATTVVNVYGGRYRTSGGLNNTDFSDPAAPGNIRLVGVDYRTGSGMMTSVVGSQSGSAQFSNATTKAVSLPVTEPDAQYVITIACNANKTFWVTAKGTTGFTLNASTTSSDTCDWRLVR